MVQSCLEGLKKPEKAIFDVTLERLGVEPEEAVFLDDLGGNLKTARLMGMSTIKVSGSVSHHQGGWGSVSYVGSGRGEVYPSSGRETE